MTTTRTDAVVIGGQAGQPKRNSTAPVAAIVALRGSVQDPRISYPPVIIKSDGPKQLFIRAIANSRQKLNALVVRIKDLFCAPGIV